ncbi:MAG: D-serine dehydratase [Firmicutes bacterium]|nr:D-serine dehydratase [Bacillota bacterium]
MRMSKIILGQSIEKWQEKYPLLQELMKLKEVAWVNPSLENYKNRVIVKDISCADIEDAQARLVRFAPYIAKVFPETKPVQGIIESPLVKIKKMQQKLQDLYKYDLLGDLYLKCDNLLPISGSIKARGGIYEVLKVAETIALESKKLTLRDSYEVLAQPEYKKLFSTYSIAVGSTGNLGLSIGIMGAVLGVKVVVHMSADAKQWKKDMLRSKGVTVVEYDADYGEAVAAGRRQAENDPTCHFIDDENSKDLFLGYAVAAKRLQEQLAGQNIIVDKEHPLFVYLPCGVGGGPGGITFGLRTVFGNHVHCFFAEPTHSPAMLLGLMTGLHDKIAVQDFGIDNVTAADGLAVGRPSGFVGKTLEKDISGVVTSADETLYTLLRILADEENIYLEPSALAGFICPVKLFTEACGQQYFAQQKLTKCMSKATHIVWATGGSMVPKAMMDYFYQQGVQANIGGK